MPLTQWSIGFLAAGRGGSALVNLALPQICGEFSVCCAYLLTWLGKWDPETTLGISTRRQPLSQNFSF